MNAAGTSLMKIFQSQLTVVYYDSPVLYHMRLYTRLHRMRYLKRPIDKSRKCESKLHHPNNVPVIVLETKWIATPSASSGRVRHTFLLSSRCQAFGFSKAAVIIVIIMSQTPLQLLHTALLSSFHVHTCLSCYQRKTA